MIVNVSRNGQSKYNVQMESFDRRDGIGEIRDNAGNLLTLERTTDHGIMIWDVCRDNHGSKRYRAKLSHSAIAVVLEIMSTGYHRVDSLVYFKLLRSNWKDLEKVENGFN